MGIIDLKAYVDKKKEDEDSQEKIFNKLTDMGIEEIEIYKILVGNFINDINSLKIFENILNDFMNEQINFLLNEGVLNTLVGPIFKGVNYDLIADIMTKEDYLMYRNKMYENLLKKYKNSDDDMPF